MIKFNFTKYTDTKLKLKYSFLIIFLWIIIGIQSLLNMNMFYLVWLAVLVTVSAYMLFTQRMKTGFNGRCKEISIEKNRITFSFWNRKQDETHKLSKLERLYFTEVPRRGKKIDPFHFFLSFKFKKQDLIYSTELPTPHILDFLDDFEAFIKENNLEIDIENKEIVHELLGPGLIEILQSLRRTPTPAS